MGGGRKRMKQKKKEKKKKKEEESYNVSFSHWKGITSSDSLKVQHVHSKEFHSFGTFQKELTFLIRVAGLFVDCESLYETFVFSLFLS